MREVTDSMRYQRGDTQAARSGCDDRLGWTVRFVRAAELGRSGVMQLCLDQYPYLASLSARPLSLHTFPAGLGAYRSHALDLAREGAVAELQSLHEELPGMDSDEAHRRRGRVHLLLRRIAPGRSTALAAVRDEQGGTHTSPSHMARALRSHWSGVFRRRPMDTGVRQRWLNEDLSSENLPAIDAAAWRLRREDVEHAVTASTSSAPGPDGVPFLAWRRLGPLGIDILHDVAQTLTAEVPPSEATLFFDGADPDMQFNASLLHFLPKGQGEQEDGVGEIFEVDCVRPLNVVNADNRLIANAARLRLEPIFDRWISPEQRGFVGGRSLLTNVLDVESEMMRAALQEEDAYAVFFDFRAAFPSIDHSFMLEVLDSLAVPPWVGRMVRALYRGNRCQLVVGSQRHAGFELQAGIRQGCPLSPLIFAVAIDVLLRRLRRKFPNVVVRVR